MREIFFDEKLGETRKNSEGVQAARAEMGGVGCEPHGQRWEGWGASRTGREGVRWGWWEWWVGSEGGLEW